MYSLKTILLFAITLLLCSTLTLAKNWAVIFVGIDAYKYTYGFEAGAYKQYNDLVKNGVDPNNIIVITPDSIAFNRRNPLPGSVYYAYNKEEFSADHPVNQYENVPVDYRNWDLEIEDFFDILAGKKSANLTALGSGRVLETGPNDNVFLYMHTITFLHIPTYFHFQNWELIFPEEFVPFIEELAAAKHFKKMYIHMHSTDGGSMFDNYLETNLGIVVYSLAGRYGDFSACHWNKWLKAYTSTCQGFEHFTYMDKAIAKNGAKETILDLYAGSGLTSLDEEGVHNLYGEFDLMMKPIKEFYGPKMKNSQPLTPTEIMLMKKEVKEQTRNRNSERIQRVLIEETPIAERIRVKTIVNKIITESLKNTDITRNIIDEPVPQRFLLVQIDCFKKTTKTMRSKCLTERNQYLMYEHGSLFAKMCSLNVPKEKIMTAIEKAC